MMYNTAVRTNTFTITEARYVARKMAADLEVFRQYYGHDFISVGRIEEYADEAEVLLAARCLNYVQFGLKVNGIVIFSIHYSASHDGTLVSDHPPGNIPPNVNTEKAAFYSFLSYSEHYHSLPSNERQALHEKINVKRFATEEPKFSNRGTWDIAAKSYAKGGGGVKRNIFFG